MSLKQRFVEKVVIITGSSTGIGRQASLDFALEGALVTIQGENADRLKEAADALREVGMEESRFCVVRGSLDKEETLNELVDTTMAKFGHIDVLVVNDVRRCKVFAQNPPGREGRMECFDSHFAAEFRSIVILTELAVPHLEETKGNIVFLTSVVANTGWPIAPIYAASKAAIESWSKTAAVKWAPKGIRVNTISLGPIKASALSPEHEQKVAQWTLQKRFGDPKEVSPILLTVASDDASFVTGATLAVDGGMLLTRSE